MRTRFERIEALFDAASALPENERDAFLATRTNDDPSLGDEVSAMLGSVRGAGTALRGVIGNAAEQTVNGATALGTRAGAYRLTAVIGEGGMGVVYRAVRDDAQFQHVVAVKVLQEGFHSPLAIARFRDERQILAGLEHPGIVRLLDGGSTEDRRPYLVMEYVEGVPITTFARGRSIDTCLELVQHVCAAVQYAHAKLVVHRDIKPSNIIVDGGGTPKLLDFGIAKLTDHDSHREAHTRTGHALLTPEYASPEQARNQPVSVATDVYSLGAVLYELLTERLPHERTSDPVEYLRRICDVDPPRPSTVAPMDRRTRLRGDVDNIVMKALHRDAARRYASVAELADDLARHRDGMPVLAREATLPYRVGKFVRRNRLGVALGILVVVALAGSTVISIRQARRANAEAARASRQLEEVRKLANAIIFEFDDQVRNLPGSTAVRVMMVSRALAYLDRVATEITNDNALTRELARAYMKIGDVQGDGFAPNLGNPTAGLVSYRKAIAMLERLGADEPALLQAHLGAGILEYSSNRFDAARAIFDKMWPAVRRAPPTNYDTYVFRAHLARYYATRQSDLQLAIGTLDDLRELTGDWRTRHRGIDTRYAYSVAHQTRADLDTRSLANPDGALGPLTAAVEELRALSREAPDDARFPREHAWILYQLGLVHGGVANAELWSAHMADPARAAELLDTALPIAVRLATGNDMQATSLVFEIEVSRAVLREARDPAGALALFEHALALHDAAPADNRASFAALRWYADCAMTHTLARLGRDFSSRAEHGLAQASDPLHAIMCRFLIARAHGIAGDPTTAARLLEEVEQSLTARVLAFPNAANGYIGLEETRTALATHRQDCGWLERAADVWSRWPGQRTPFIERRLTAIAQRRATCVSNH